ncbi:MAG: SH3 domain-containing protein, partial [Phycisphaerales bacterium]|nr:SH3 domain-containing protein [Phycisphaerales bacterium]
MTNQHILWKTAAVVTTTVSVAIHAQEQETTDNSWIGAITSDGVAVRCGANESYYPITHLTTGDTVTVVGKRQDWYQVNTGGSSFNSVVGYIKYPEKDSSVFVVEGETGTAGGDIEIIAKNVESDEMYRSWRPVYRMQDGETVRIIQTEAMAPGTLHREAYIVHTVSLPPNATAWINVSNITKTTPNEELIEDVELGENIDTEAGSEQLDEG